MVNIPSIRDLYNDILQDLQTEFQINIPVFGKLFLRALAAVQAAKLKLYYLQLGNVQKNLFPDVADTESMGGTLERQGRLKLNRNPFPATSAKYEISITVTGTPSIPTGTLFRSSESALNAEALYITDEDYSIDQINNRIIVRAVTPGVESKLNTGDALSCTVPIVGMTGDAVVESETVSPTAAETEEDYRNAIIDSYRLAPQGGAAADYILWAQDAEGVKNSYPYTSSGNPGEVDIYIEATIADSTDGMGTPSSTILGNVEAVIEIDPNTGVGRRPLGVWAVNVLPVVINKVFIDIANSTGLTTDQKNTLGQAIKEQIDLIRPFIAGADILDDKNDMISTNQIVSWIINAIPGAAFGNITLTIQEGTATPLAVTSKVFSYGNIPFLESISYA